MSEQQTAQEQAIPTELTIDDALTYARLLQQKEHVEDAIQLYTRILEKVPDHVDALHLLGVAKFQLGDGEAAVELLNRSIALQPDFASAHNNLGNVLNHLHRFAEAAQAYRHVIALEPANVHAYNNLGVALRVDGQVAEAEKVLRRALELDPQHIGVFHNLGNVLIELDRLEEAADMYTQAVLLRPYDARNYYWLGTTLYRLRREQEALKVYEKWLELDPDNCEAQHMAAAGSRRAVPPRASDAYVQSTFDGFAARFDVTLKNLQYQAPQLLADLVDRVMGPGQGALDVLDVGCGTGLCGPLLKPWARRLVGIDLSPKMIEKARLREVYDDLVIDELTAYLSTHPAAYDLLISADTLCYFGDLTGVVAAAAASLQPAGRFGFTLEKAEESDAPDGYCIQCHGRYSQTASYVRSVLAAAGLEVVSIEEAVLRMERKDPVRGLVVMAAKPAA